MMQVEKICKETRGRIIQLSQGFEEFSRGNIRGIRGENSVLSIDQDLAYRLGQLCQDYLSMTIPKIENAEMYALLSADPGPNMDFLNCITIGDFLQLVDCIADIRASCRLLGDLKFSLRLSELEREVALANRNLLHFFSNYNVEEIKTAKNAVTLRDNIMRITITGITTAIVRFMVDIFNEISEENKQVPEERHFDLETLAASCSMYMKQIGFDFNTHKWAGFCEGDMKAQLSDIGAWRNWGSSHCGKVYVQPLYLAWYNPLDGNIYESSITITPNT